MMADNIKILALLPLIFDAIDDAPEFVDAVANTKSYQPVSDRIVLAHSAEKHAAWKQNELFNHRLMDFVESDVPRYNDVTFKAHFRMSRSTFQGLLEAVAPHLECKTTSMEKKVLSTVWLLSNDESYRGVADRFDLSKGTLHFIFLSVCGAVKFLDTVRWPTPSEMRTSASVFEDRHGLSGVIGCIDGSHIPITGRGQDRSSFINRKGFSSMILQCICNENMSFIDAYTGWPGSVHDSRVFRNSPINCELDKMSPSYHLLGDSAYPLSISLITPFRDNGCLNEQEKRFNAVHSSTRSIIERAFGLLKGKFRRLKSLNMCLDCHIPEVIMACVYLHNFILKNEGSEDVEPLPTTGNFEDVHYCNGAEKRLSLAASL